jgi:hypothetical protein
MDHLISNLCFRLMTAFLRADGRPSTGAKGCLFDPPEPGWLDAGLKSNPGQYLRYRKKHYTRYSAFLNEILGFGCSTGRISDKNSLYKSSIRDKYVTDQRRMDQLIRQPKTGFSRESDRMM